MNVFPRFKTSLGALATLDVSGNSNEKFGQVIEISTHPRYVSKTNKVNLPIDFGKKLD